MPKKATTRRTAPPAGGRKGAAAPKAAAGHPVWPAGIEALAKARQEGVSVFETLLKQGQRLEQKTREAAADTAAAARGAAAAKAREMQQMAGGTWDKLEQVFEDRVARALAKLGIYTQNDVQRLADRVDQLAEAVNRLTAARGATPEPPVPRAKPASKRASKTAGK